ncbi:hypothetical protein FNW52_09110 [Flavobacterium sp. ZT3R18]|uniref:hypothetical protein n=1 Tax=Flavobacterium sp. ZT3R18 TaxID=2594429 RepID=UPI00117A213D|nr:hypothetical protein [Flavobacterium sp. ZT3R18]TRX36174.1 hypothetical protein FNW52_09110 [Flavobacterium sp. ZT3R18]
MKKIILFASLLLLYSCKTGLITNQEKKGDYMFEKMDYNKWEKDNAAFKDVENPSLYNLKDGSFVDPSYPDWGILPPKPAFYTIYKLYYKNSGIIKEKGKYFGECDPGSTIMKIGIWTYFDEQGKVIREEDEDKKFGAFGYNEVLAFLDHEGQINLRNGKNREKLEIYYDFSKNSSEKLWKVVVEKGKPYSVPNLDGMDGERMEQKVKTYYLDGNTGEIIARKDLIKYKEIIPGFEWTYPDLK